MSAADMTHHPLQALDARRLNGYTLHLGEIKQLRMSGWKGFTLHLKDDHGFLTPSPVIRGIFSVGGKDGIQPWMDVQYWEQVELSEATGGANSMSLTSDDLDRKLFRILGDTIPAGGHLMVSYEDEQAIHNETLRSLNIGIPPAITPLGLLLFQAGFEHVKNWYLSEGGFEGPRKLWAEKALTVGVGRDFLKNTASQVHTFLERGISSDNRNDKELEEAARGRSKEVLGIVEVRLGC